MSRQESLEDLREALHVVAEHKPDASAFSVSLRAAFFVASALVHAIGSIELAIRDHTRMEGGRR